MINKKKILFVNDEMKMGGVARVLNTLMASLPQDRYEIDLLVLHKDGMLLKEVPSNVNVISGTAFFCTVDESLFQLLKERDYRKICSKLRLLLYMKTGLIKKKIESERKKILKKTYDVEVAAKEGFCTIFTAYGDSKRKINWVLTDYSVCNYSSNHMRLVKQALQNIDLNIADSEQALIAYKTVFRVSNGITIHNLMDVAKIEKALLDYNSAAEIKDRGIPNIITVARFHPQKSIDRLIRASYDAHCAGIPHHLYLVGGGALEEYLRKQVHDLKLDDSVTFLGYRENPYAMIEKCDLFVLTSLYEGFATVISESLIVGTPVLTTEVSGTKEQIVEGWQGWIVDNNQTAISAGLIHALTNTSLLKDMKCRLIEYEYPNQEILNQFMENL